MDEGVVEEREAGSFAVFVEYFEEFRLNIGKVLTHRLLAFGNEFPLFSDF